MTGVTKVNNTNNTNNANNVNNNGDLSKEKLILENKRDILVSKGVKYDAFAKYTDGESYDLKIITEVLDPSFVHCKFDKYRDNPITKNYCSLKEPKEPKSVHTEHAEPYYMFGGFMIVASLMISGSLYLTTKKRELAAYSVQQIRPVAEEGIEKITPTIGKAAGTMAKEISKGIKEGLQDNDEE